MQNLYMYLVSPQAYIQVLEFFKYKKDYVQYILLVADKWSLAWSSKPNNWITVDAVAKGNQLRTYGTLLITLQTVSAICMHNADIIC
jgi:hypothetical protein